MQADKRFLQRLILAAVVLSFLDSQVAAQVLRWEKGRTEFPPRSETVASDSAIQPPKAAHVEPQKPVVLTLHPQAEPQPALKYQFWPPAHEQVRGNAVVPTLRSMLLMKERADYHEQRRLYLDRSRAWTQSPLHELPRDEVRNYLQYFRATLAELKHADIMDSMLYDINIASPTREDPFTLLLPELNELRELGRLVQLDIRLALAEHRYDDAIASMKTGFRLSHTASQMHQLLIGRLVGAAIGQMVLATVEEAVALPNMPNLYWALASLPQDAWSMPGAMQGEVLAIHKHLSALYRVPDEPISAGAAQELLDEVLNDYLEFSAASADPRPQDSVISVPVVQRAAASLWFVSYAAKSREILRVREPYAARLEEYPVEQQVLLASRLEIDEVLSEFLKPMLLPSDLRQTYLTRFQDNFRTGAADLTPARAYAALVLPAAKSADQAALRVPQKIALMMTVEAIRASAASTGSLPASLRDLSPIPAIDDPATGEAFEYERVTERTGILKRKLILTEQVPLNQYLVELK